MDESTFVGESSKVYLPTTTEFMLTTNDNPFDPFDNFKEWIHWDISHGRDTCGYLMRVAHTSDSLTDEENNAEVERAIDEILKYDIECIYKKLSKPAEKAS